MVTQLWVLWNVSFDLFFAEKPLVIGYKVKVCDLYVFSNVSSNIHYLRMSSDAEHKEFTCMDSQMFLQIFVIWENIWTLVTRLRFITCMCSLMSLQISIIWECLQTKSARVLFRMCMYFERSLFKLQLYVFSSVFLNLYYLRKPLGTNHKVMVSKLYV